jgi:Asp-tRNA(Asn)/Glu-tRNA(Gln) amidotransferase A subunit family amidase
MLEDGNHLLDPLLRLARILAAEEGALAHYLDELQTRFDSQEPQLQAFLPEPDRFSRLQRQAAALSARFPDPQQRPPLYGLPIGVKDIFQVEGFETRAGSRLPAQAFAGPQAVSVTRLLEAGALILGKTVSTEFAYFAPGPTRNPHNPAHTPGGSSSGSAAAVGAGLTPLALGSQTIGSIIRPAAFCGVAGFKPSYERASRAGVIPLSPSLDHVGWFTQGVAGAALTASVVIADWNPGQTSDRLPTLAVPGGPYLERAGASAIAALESARQRLSQAGYTILEIPAMPDFEAIVERHQRILAIDAAQVHESWFAAHEALYHPRTAELIRRGQTLDHAALESDRAAQLAFRHTLTALMDEHAIDLWLAPSAPGPAPRGLESTGDPIMNLPWTQSGLPVAGMPCGLDEQGLPLGIQLVARFGADEMLLAWAEGIENELAFHQRRLE